MKKLPILYMLFIISLLSVVGMAQEFGPPKYIANSETGECRYYFSGDAAHFNPRPDGFDVDIGLTTTFGNNQTLACSMWVCEWSKGTWTADGCDCPVGGVWNETQGCFSPDGAELITPEELCDSTRGVWASGLCTCTAGEWSADRGCVDNGNVVSSFDDGAFGGMLWGLIIIAVILFALWKLNVIKIPKGRKEKTIELAKDEQEIQKVHATGNGTEEKKSEDE